VPEEKDVPLPEFFMPTRIMHQGERLGDGASDQGPVEPSLLIATPVVTTELLHHVYLSVLNDVDRFKRLTR